MTLKNYLPTIFMILVSVISVPGQAQSQYDKGTPPQLAAGVASPGSYISTELGTVNLSNGGLNINIPLGTVGGRGGVAVPLSLSYSSKIWSASTDVDIEQASWTEQSVAYADYDNQSSFAGAAAPGWTLRTGMFLTATFVRIKRITSGPNAGCHTYGLTKLTLNMPDKGEIEFRDDATDGAPLPLNCATQQTASRGTRWHSTDGSGAIFVNDVENGVSLFPTANLSGTITFADGTRFGSTTNGAIVDRNGNRVSFATNGYVDQLGRSTTIQYGVPDPENPSITLAVLITVPGYQGTPRYYKVRTGIMNQSYRSDINPTLPVISGDWDPEGWGYNWGSATRLFSKSYGLYAQRIDDLEVLTEVVLPDGRSLRFRYNQFGEVAEIELPTGGKIQYDYGYTSAMPSGNSPSWETGTDGAGTGIPSDVKWVDRSVQVKRTYPDGVNLEGTWTFGYSSQTVGGVTYPATIVSVNSNGSVLLSKQRHLFLPGGRYTEPYNSQSLHDGTHYSLWSTGIEWRTESLDAAGNVLAATEQDWSQRAPVSWSTYPQEQPAKDNRVNQTRRYLETGMMAKVEAFYDQYNNPIEVKEYDYDQTLKRRTVTSYLSTNNGYNYQTDDSIHLLALPATQTIYDGNGNQVARTITEYDVYTNDGNRNVLTSYPSVSQHDSSNYGTAKTTRGNPTRIGTWLNTTGNYVYTYPRYDVLGNVVSAKDARGNVSTVSFADDYGNGSNPGNPSQNPSTPTYAFGTLITSPPPVPGAPVHTARSQYDYSTGLLTGFRDRNNVITQTIYNDPFNRPTQVKSAVGISGVESHALTYYAPATTPFGITLAKSDTLIATDQAALDDANLRTWSVTDGFGRTRESWTRDPQGNVKVATIYDALHRARQVSSPFRPSLSEAEAYTTTAYDLLGRVTTVTGPDGSVVSTSHSANSVTVTDQTSRKRKSVSDALGRLKEVYEDPDGLNYTTSYQYDALDNLLSVVQGSQTRTFSYNSFKQLTSVTNPESGTVSYQYDDVGNTLVKTDARGVSAHYAYDAFNRVTRRWYNGSSSASATTQNSPSLPAGVGASNEANYYYDVQPLPSGAPSFTRGAANGRLVAVTYGTGSSVGDYAGYDVAGRNTLKIQQTGGINYQITAALNLAGAAVAVVYPSGRSVNYSHDVGGRTSSVVGNLGDGSNRNYGTELSYSSSGGLTKEKFGTSAPVYHKLHYNVRGQLYDVRASNVNDEWGGEIGALANFYSANGVHGGSGPDNNGNLIKSQTIVNSYLMEDRYSYDPLNRLTAVSEYQSGTTNTGKQEYEYDRWGNRTIKTTTWGTGINNKQFTVNAANNRLGVPAGQSGVMTYDAAGNLTNDTYSGAGNRTYDAENKIISAWGGNNQAQLYSYDASGQRIKRIVDGVETWQVYGFGGELIAEYPANSPASSPQKEYGYRNGQLLVVANSLPLANLALNKTATQSSTHASGAVAARAVDGNTDGVFANGSVTHTLNDANAWWQLDLGQVQSINAIKVWNRVEAPERLANFYVFVSDVPFTSIDLTTTQNQAGVSSYHTASQCGFPTQLSINRTGRYIRVQLAGTNYLSIAELQVLGTVAPSNVALGKTATQSSTTNSATASRAVDGNTSGVFANGSVTHTSSELNAWWHVDLGQVETLGTIKVWNRVEFQERLTNFYVFVSDQPFTSNNPATTQNQAGVSTYYTAGQCGFPTELSINRTGRYVRVQLAGTNYLSIAEVQVWTGSSSPPVQWLVSDHLGTPRIIIDQSGSPASVKRHDYLPFGEELFAPVGGRTVAMGYASGDNVRQQFTSKERDVETGLDYFLARYYSPQQGRFTSIDPVAMTVGRLYDPQQINLYLYCRNNPLVFIDPTGEQIDYADQGSREAYDDYEKFLNSNQKKYASELATLQQLKDSDVTYVINVASNASEHGQGELTTDGTKIFININSNGGPLGEAFSQNSRFAHELEHGRQFDSGELSFIKDPKTGEWQTNPATYDIGDEIKAFKVQQNAASDSDYFTRKGGTTQASLLSKLNNAKNDVERADILARNGYPNRNQRMNSNLVYHSDSGYKPGQLIRTNDYFGRVNRVFERPK